MERKPRNAIFKLILFFFFLNGFFLSSHNLLNRWGADSDVLVIGNLFLFGITIASFFIAKKGMLNSNPHAFIRGVYVSIMLKLFACIIAAFIYISIYKTSVNKPALFTLMGLYLIYTFIEISLLTRLLRGKANG
jgi:hypothetical protein